jgi:hypothetical protein
MTRLGFKAVPGPEPGLPKPPSMITAVEMGSREGMVAFCKGIQLACPVGSYIRPEPGEHCRTLLKQMGAQQFCALKLVCLLGLCLRKGIQLGSYIRPEPGEQRRQGTHCSGDGQQGRHGGFLQGHPAGMPGWVVHSARAR